MNIKNQDDLLREKKEESMEFHTPASKIVRSMFSKELSGHNWVKYSKEDILKMIDEKAKELNIPENESHVFLLRKALKSQKSVQDMIMRMTSFLIGEAS